MRCLLISFLAVCFLNLSGQQRPFVNNLDKTSGTVGEKITISGSGFSSGNMQVNFGAGIASITNTTTSLIEVTVPATATFGPVTVLNKNTGLSGQSSSYFSPSFSGEAFDVSAVGSSEIFPTGQNFTYDVCSCDFDGDGKIDIAAANNDSDNVSIFRNTSTLATSSFAREDIANGFTTISTECKDLNGDGKPDLVFTTNSSTIAQQVAVYRNTSTSGNIAFVKLEFQFPNRPNGDRRNPRKFQLGDLDGDGRADLVIGNESDNSLFAYRNTSSGSGNAISFDTPLEIQATEASNTGVVILGDLDNNGQLDILTSSNTSQGSIYLFQNESSPGKLQFSTPEAFGAASQERLNMTLGDINSDGLLDLITANTLKNKVEVFVNSSSQNTISFNEPSVEILNIIEPWGIESADINGDGLIDINIGSTANIGAYVLENQSDANEISFSPKQITTPGNRNISISDINGDGKLDFVFAVESELNGNGEILVITNRNCIVPEISPKNTTFCLGNPFSLEATKSVETSYNWTVMTGNATINTNGSSTANVTVNSGTEVTFQVEITSNDGLCTAQGTETFILTGGSPPSAPSIVNSNTGTVCAGESFNLTGTAGRDSYIWTLPDGEEITQSSNVLVISEATSANSGTYQLRVLQAGSCVSEIGTLNVAVDEPPTLSIFNNGTDDFCENSNVTLEVPDYPGFTYQWKNESGNISGETNNTYTASASGDYSVDIISAVSGCVNSSPTYTINAIGLPSSRFVATDEICVGVSTTFLSSSTIGSGATDYTLNYDWDFDNDSTRGSIRETAMSFETSGTYSVTLVTGYDEIPNCSTTVSNDIMVSAPSSVSISLPEGEEKCPADSLRLELPANFQSYNWSTGSTTRSAYAKTAPDEEEVTIDVDMITNIGCEVSSSVTVSNYTNSRLIISSPDASIVSDSIELASGISTVLLNAENGQNYQWSPTDILRILSADSSSVEAFPRDEFTTISVTGPDMVNECITTASVVLQTPGVIPRKSFSPNGDGQGFDCWEILNTQNVNGCTVFIFDQRGSSVFKGSSPFADNCVWNGNIDNGSSPAPEGIYYFVMKCEESRFEKSGAILLAR